MKQKRKKTKNKGTLSREEAKKIFRELKIGSLRPYLPDPDFSLEEIEAAERLSRLKKRSAQGA